MGYLEILDSVGPTIALSTWVKMKNQGDPFTVPEEVDSATLQTTLSGFEQMLTHSNFDIQKLRTTLLKELDNKIRIMSGVSKRQEQSEKESILRGIPWKFEGALFFRNIPNSRAVIGWTDFTGLQRLEENGKPRNLKISFTPEERKKYGILHSQKIRTLELSPDGKEMYFLYKGVPHLFRASLVNEADKPLSKLKPESIRRFKAAANHYLVRSNSTGKLLYQNGEESITALIDPRLNPETDIIKPMYHHEFISFTPNDQEIVAVKGTRIFRYDLSLESIGEPVPMRDYYHALMLPLHPNRIFDKPQRSTHLHPDGRHILLRDFEQKGMSSLQLMNIKTGYTSQAAVPSKYLMQVHSKIHRSPRHTKITLDGRYTVTVWEDITQDPNARKLRRPAVITLYDSHSKKAYSLNLWTSDTEGLNINSTSGSIMVAYPSTRRVEFISIEDLKSQADEITDIPGS